MITRAPSQAVAFAPELVKMGKKWHIAYADYAWGQSTRDAYADEIKKSGGEVIGTTGIPIGTADMTPFLSKITGSFEAPLLLTNGGKFQFGTVIAREVEVADQADVGVEIDAMTVGGLGGEIANRLDHGGPVASGRQALDAIPLTKSVVSNSVPMMVTASPAVRCASS